MGQDKALLMLEGEPLIARGLRTLSEVCDEVAIAGGSEELKRFARLIPDSRPGCGPLGGIVAALEHSICEWNVFLPVDVPFVPVSVLQALLEAVNAEVVCVMARSVSQVQPLCAVYARRALGALQHELEEGHWKIMEAVAAAGPVRMIDFAHPGWFLNVNTSEEFAAAERIIRR